MNKDREFDIREVAGHKMPYQRPNDEFFEALSDSVLKRIESDKESRIQRRRVWLGKTIASSITAAAASVMLLCGAYFYSDVATAAMLSTDELAFFIDDLSDDELLMLFNDTEFEETFYSAL